MSNLNSLMNLLREYRKQLSEKKAEKQKYLNIAGEIGKIYDRMAGGKELVRCYRNNVNVFYNEQYDTFRGYLYTNAYRSKIEELLQDYDLVIGNIDTNMDRLNTERAHYENKAYECNGIIGYLQSAINSLVHTIENWVN